MNESAAKTSSFPARLAFPKSLKSNKKKFVRRHKRNDCVVLGIMTVIDIGAEFDGALTELSCGGCTFRQASMFVLDRMNESVRIHTEFFEVEGRIRAVRPDGYGIQFSSEVDEAVIDGIVAHYGFKVSDSFLAKRN